MKSPAYIKLCFAVVKAMRSYEFALRAYMLEVGPAPRRFHRLVTCNGKLEEAIRLFDVYGGTAPRERDFFHQLRYTCRYHYGKTFRPFGARK